MLGRELSAWCPAVGGEMWEDSSQTLQSIGVRSPTPFVVNCVSKLLGAMSVFSHVILMRIALPSMDRVSSRMLGCTAPSSRGVPQPMPTH